MTRVTGCEKLSQGGWAGRAIKDEKHPMSYWWTELGGCQSAIFKNAHFYAILFPLFLHDSLRADRPTCIMGKRDSFLRYFVCVTVNISPHTLIPSFSNFLSSSLSSSIPLYLSPFFNLLHFCPSFSLFLCIKL